MIQKFLLLSNRLENKINCYIISIYFKASSTSFSPATVAIPPTTPVTTELATLEDAMAVPTAPAVAAIVDAVDAAAAAILETTPANKVNMHPPLIFLSKSLLESVVILFDLSFFPLNNMQNSFHVSIGKNFVHIKCLIFF